MLLTRRGGGTLGSRSTPQPMWDIGLEFDKGRQQTESQILHQLLNDNF